MKQYDKDEALAMMDRWGGEGRPFLFVTDYGCRRMLLSPTDEIDPSECLYCFRGKGNSTSTRRPGHRPQWRPDYPTYEEYARSFDIVRRAIMAGDSYLANLTCRVPVETDVSMLDIYHCSTAPYRLWLKDRLVCFSPETFVRIDEEGTVSSYPMKGTIDASLPDAERTLMDDPKEAAEHATVVDLIRNDLSIVATDVHVARYRYVERLSTNRGELLQTSSEIVGRLAPGFRRRIGSAVFAQLPAGSITGAPKRKTVEIIARAEGYDRGFYTGVTGLFDGQRLDSAVMIRFIDTDGRRLFFKAGGGITSRSSCRSEYEEMKEKIYVQFC